MSDLQPDRSLGELFGELSGDMGALFRQELELAKAEAREEMRHVGRAAGMFAGAGVAGLVAALMIAAAAAWLLDRAMPTDLAFLLVGVVAAVAALAMKVAGRRELDEVTPMPDTTETLKEDLQWTRRPTR